jgi:replication factor A1
MRKKFWRGRGRLPNRMHSHKEERILEYLAMMAVKYKIDSNEFFNCIVKAWNKGESGCKQLKVRCRKRMRDSAIFIFTAGYEVLAQFPISTRILKGENDLKNYMDNVCVKAPSVEGAANLKIKDLHARMKKVSLKARVLKVPERNMVYTRFGAEAYVANVLIGDETGRIRIALWNLQIDKVSEGDLIRIENCRVASFRGERQLRIGKHGKITVVKNAEYLSN